MGYWGSEMQIGYSFNLRLERKRTGPWQYYPASILHRREMPFEHICRTSTDATGPGSVPQNPTCQ